MKHLKVYLMAAAVAAAGTLALNAATAQSRIDRTGAAPSKINDCSRDFSKKYKYPASKAYDCRSEFKPVCRNGTVLGPVKLERDGDDFHVVYTCEDPSR